jgi:hypothetical protein
MPVQTATNNPKGTNDMRINTVKLSQLPVEQLNRTFHDAIEQAIFRIQASDRDSFKPLDVLNEAGIGLGDVTAQARYTHQLLTAAAGRLIIRDRLTPFIVRF